MKIAFDSQIFSVQKHGGISRYVCGLANSLSLCPDVEVKIFAPLYVNAYLPKLSSKLVFGKKIPMIPKTGRLVRAASQILARQVMGRFRPDIVHETYYSSNAFALRGARRVITVHDMIYERFPSEFSDRQLPATKKIAVSRADHVLCVSESTRRDLIDILGTDADRVSVVHNGFNELALSTLLSNESGLHADTRPFLLYVGSRREGYKNFGSLLRAFASSSYLKSNFSLVCFGGGAFLSEELSLIRELKLADTQVRHMGGGDEVLARLYRRAAAFVCPSRYEGFGFPLLEAMSLGCPVVCSNTSSIPEVVGDAGEYFDPGDSVSMCAAIESVLESKTRRDELVTKGYARCALFSWTRCAKETLNIYRGLV